MEVTLELSELTVKRMRAFQAGERLSADQVASIVSKIVEDGLEDICNSSLQLSNRREIKVNPLKELKKTIHEITQDEDEIDVAYGLGDDDLEQEEIEPVEKPDELLPKIGGLSDDVLNHDMDVEDPSLEAKSEALPGDVNEDEFSTLVVGEQVVKLEKAEPIHHEEFVDHRILKRAKKNILPKGKAKISPLTPEEEAKSPISDM